MNPEEPTDPTTILELDLSLIPLCCGSCGARCEYHESTSETPGHFHCMVCDLVYDHAVLMSYLHPVLVTAHHQ